MTAFAETLEGKVWQANVSVHAKEASIYDDIHEEIFNFIEQRRLRKALARASSLATCKNRLALDFGCGTGNLTSKLLDLGWKVVAADISDSMLTILRQKLPEACSSRRLQIVKIASKELEFPDEHFGMVAAYSVLHHLFDYMHTIKEMCRVLDKGGVLYLDNEASDRSWDIESKVAYSIVNCIYQSMNRVNYFLGQTYLKYRHEQVPHIDYTWSDYRIREATKIDWKLIRGHLTKRGFRFYEENHLLHRTLVLNPFYPLMSVIGAHDIRTLVAVKTK
ncbi:MAG: class I SAM-dependent methyltransferase [Candidatus Bathyarchaeia archaeon]|jgi:ubiquinone/menaquinone biosynthesis C-methylase UbiE